MGKLINRPLCGGIKSSLWVAKCVNKTIVQPCFLYSPLLTANYFHDKKYFFSRQEIFFFMKIISFFHEDNSGVEPFTRLTPISFVLL